MRAFLGISFAMLIWGSSVFANAPIADTAQDLKNIKSWTAHLNHYYPTLDLSVGVPLNSNGNRTEVLKELNALESDLRGVVDVPVGALLMLACDRPECGTHK